MCEKERFRSLANGERKKERERDRHCVTVTNTNKNNKRQIKKLTQHAHK